MFFIINRFTNAEYKNNIIRILFCISLIFPTIIFSQQTYNDPQVVVINENFKAATSSFGEDPYWKLKNGFYSFTDENDTEYRSRWIKRSFTDCTISVKARWDGRAADNGFGIYFGGSYNDSLDYCFMITKNGNYQLLRWDGTGWEKIIPWTATNLIRGGFNDLKISCSNKNILGYINGVNVFNTYSAPYVGGYTGLYCSGLVDASFDEFIVTTPSGVADINKQNNANAFQPINENFSGQTCLFGEDEYFKLGNGIYIFSGRSESQLRWRRITTFYANCTISVKTRWDGNAVNNGSGIYFGGSDESCYAFMISPNGYYEMLKWTGVEWKNIVAWTKTDIIGTGFNDLKVVCNGTNISAYLNNIQVINTYINDFKGGYTGLAASCSMNASFANYSVIPSGN